MTRFAVKVTRRAKAGIRDLPEGIRERVLLFTVALEESVSPPGFDVKPMAEMKGWWKARFGGYRVVYEVEEDLVTVYRVATREQAYGD